MSRTTFGGVSRHQVAANRGRELIREGHEQKKGFESLRDSGNKPKIKLGPLNLRKRT